MHLYQLWKPTVTLPKIIQHSPKRPCTMPLNKSPPHTHTHTHPPPPPHTPVPALEEVFIIALPAAPWLLKKPVFQDLLL